MRAEVPKFEEFDRRVMGEILEGIAESEDCVRGNLIDGEPVFQEVGDYFLVAQVEGREESILYLHFHEGHIEAMLVAQGLQASHILLFC